MAVDELTDEAFFDLYQKNPQIKQIVDNVQKKYHTHFSQKGQPGYNESNIPIAMKDAKETVQQLLEQQKQGTESKLKPENKPKGTLESFFEGVERAFSNPLFPATVTALALVYIGMPYMPP